MQVPGTAGGLAGQARKGRRSDAGMDGIQVNHHFQPGLERCPGLELLPRS